MRVLIVHTESRYFAGAQKVLGYFLEGLRDQAELEVGVAMVASEPVAAVIPPGCAVWELPANQVFGPLTFLRQVMALRRIIREQGCDVVHGWTARDWESAAVAGKLGGRKVVGTLHDHPRAAFLSKTRAALMKGAARGGLDRVVCVSAALSAECARQGYPAGKLQVVYNGLPAIASAGRAEGRGGANGLRLGFLGAFSRRKGLDGFFEILDCLERFGCRDWQAFVAGGAQDQEGHELERLIRERFQGRPWWGQVVWVGWVKQPADFLGRIDVLVCPSVEFDPFPTVLLEAGFAGVPVLATRVGGIPEIVVDREGGWLLDVGAWEEGARMLRDLAADGRRVVRAGCAHRDRVTQVFSVAAMVRGYRRVYGAF